MRDLALLTWLRWRHVRGRIRFWAAIGGADLESGSLTNRLYAVYLAIVVVIWLYLMWASATDVVFESGVFGGALYEPALRSLALLPVMTLVAATVRTLRSSPVKFTFEDMAYVAGTPLDRGALALLDFARETLLWVLAAGLAGFLIGVAAVDVTDVHQAIRPAIAAALSIATTVAAANALAWFAGLLRMAARRGRPWPQGVWLASLALGVVALLAEKSFAWLGSAITAPLRAATAPQAVAVLVLTLVGGVIGVIVTGRRLDTVRVVDESTLYAQIQVFRPLAIYDSRAVRDITRRKKLALRRPVGAMPTATGVGALVARAWVSHMRRPSTLLAPLLWGAVLVPSAVLLSAETRPLLLYFPWFFALMMAPADGLVQVFRDDMDRPSLRELLPFDNLTLAVFDGLPALSLMLVASVLFWLVGGRSTEFVVPAASLSVLLGITLFLCRALEHVRILDLKRPLGFPVTAGVSCVAILYAGAGGSLLTGAFAAMVCIAVLALALGASKA